MGPQMKDISGRYGFPDFYSAFVSTTGLESFSTAEKFSKRFSFGGGSVPFLLPCHCSQTYGKKRFKEKSVLSQFIGLESQETPFAYFPSKRDTPVAAILIENILIEFVWPK